MRTTSRQFLPSRLLLAVLLAPAAVRASDERMNGAVAFVRSALQSDKQKVNSGEPQALLWDDGGKEDFIHPGEH